MAKGYGNLPYLLFRLWDLVLVEFQPTSKGLALFTGPAVSPKQPLEKLP